MLMRLTDLNALDDDAAVRELLRCCGSSRWARTMAASRPFSSMAAIERAADEVWLALEAPDILEAFAAHPKIGAGEAGRAGGDGAPQWSAQEQSGVRDA